MHIRNLWPKDWLFNKIITVAIIKPTYFVLTNGIRKVFFAIVDVNDAFGFRRTLTL